ncbi:MAG: helix-turn-helix transcriptional regulator [Deltaproteobacteria bacterium]|nr:helix-turn-helix transcriptional regulator [Deltaproteobacteria bacterium]
MKRYSLINARGRQSQADIAKKCGVAQQTYSHWEVGRTTPPIKKMLFLEKLFGVPKEVLFPDVFNSEIEFNFKGDELGD